MFVISRCVFSQADKGNALPAQYCGLCSSLCGAANLKACLLLHLHANSFDMCTQSLDFLA